jgi:hypothetical protein
LVESDALGKVADLRTVSGDGGIIQTGLYDRRGLLCFVYIGGWVRWLRRGVLGLWVSQDWSLGLSLFFHFFRFLLGSKLI